MKYLADLLTLTRFILGLVLLRLVFVGGHPETAFLIFLVGVLTDAFDGTCSRKWPFKKGQEPWYRKYASKYDMVADVLLAAAQVLFLTFHVDFFIGLAFIVYYIGICGVIELVVYGKFFGHPDDYTQNSLMQKDFPLAKKIILIRRHSFALCLGIINAVILYATSWPNFVKNILFILGCLIFVFMWFFLSQRRHNITRHAVKIEKELSKKKSR